MIGDGGKGIEAGLDASDERFGDDSNTGGVEVGVIGLTADDGDGTFTSALVALTDSPESAAVCTDAGLDTSDEGFEDDGGAIGLTDDDEGDGTFASTLTGSSDRADVCAAGTFLRLSADAALTARRRFEDTLFRLNFCASIRA